MGAFDNARIVKINNKEIDSIKTNDGTVIYQRPIIIDIYGDSITLGYGTGQWMVTNGNVIVNWGDGTTNTVNNPTTQLSHTYTDNKQFHSVTLLGTVTALGYTCFHTCNDLVGITIPNSVKSLAPYCFYNCINLVTVYIPSSITSIGDNCFDGCTNLIDYELYWTGNSIITYSSSKMINNTNTKFYVPKGQKTNYVNKGYPSAKVVERSS